MPTPLEQVDQLLSSHKNVQKNLSRSELVQESIDRHECIVTQSGAVAIWNPKNATGRIPKDTYTVKHPDTHMKIDWKMANNIAMDPELFDSLLADAVDTLGQKDALFVLDRSVGADPKYTLPVRTISPRSISALFADNMFRALPADLSQSIFAGQMFTVVVVPIDRVRTEKYEGKLRQENGKTMGALIALDLDRRIALIYGTQYCGAIKKSIFTVMNALLPSSGVLSLHCSASADSEGNSHLFLGLSGTGKTTLSVDPKRSLIGDDEHMWGDDGVANLENGSYAKLIKLRKDKEPMIFEAVFGKRPVLEHGCILENTMVYPDGYVDVDDDRLTENSRAAFPLSFVGNVVESARGGHPKTVVFLTADANGVLPPVSVLTHEQAMLWFLMGYTSKLAGTEAGVTSPTSTFSRFFGGPFMPLESESYLNLLRDKLEKHGTQVYLINTGWTSGAYGVGHRMDINLTRAVVDAALGGQLKDVECRDDTRFHLRVPLSCPGVEAIILDTKSTWADKDAYEAAANKLAGEFSAYFDKMYKGAVPPEVEAMCPGK